MACSGGNPGDWRGYYLDRGGCGCALLILVFAIIVTLLTWYYS